MKNEFDFNQFLPTGDEMIDKILVDVGKLILKAESGCHEPIQEKINVLMALYKTLCKYFEGTDTKIEYKVNYPLPSMGYVRLNAKEIVFDKPGSLFALGAVSDGIDFCPKADGTVDLEFTFRGLTRKVKEN